MSMLDVDITRKTYAAKGGARGHQAIAKLGFSVKENEYIGSHLWFGEVEEPALVEWKFDQVDGGTLLEWSFTQDTKYPMGKLGMLGITEASTIRKWSTPCTRQ